MIGLRNADATAVESAARRQQMTHDSRG